LPVVAAWGVAVARRKHLGLGIFVSLLTILVLATRPSGSNSDADMPAGSVAPSFIESSFTRPLFIGHFTEDWRGAVAFVREHDREGRHAVFLWAGLIEAAQLDAEDGPWPEPPSSHEPENAAEIAASPTNGAADQEALQQYLLFPISGPYALDDGRTRLPMTPRHDRWLTPGSLRQTQASGGGWFIFRSPKAIYPDHPRPIERLARDLTEEFAEGGLRSRATHRQSFRGLAVIHLSVR
jgi:hypothetical protein